MSYTLVICEKPSAAKKIADSLAEGKIEEVKRLGASYYKIKRSEKDLVVVPVVGHLFVLDERKRGIEWNYPVFDVEWKPVFDVNKNNTWSRKYYENIKHLVNGADEFVSACDYDIEGSLIAYNSLRLICGVKDGKRMKFSTLTTDELREAYDAASKHLDFPQIEAGIARHFLDWYWGINMSRALTLSLKQVGAYKTLSTGRVQGPTLNILEKRQLEIDKFKPEKFWQIILNYILDKKELIATHTADKFWDKKEADKIFEKCKGKDGAVESIEKKKTKQSPPYPFDLTTLQRESYSNFGFSPKQTLDIAQSLYEQALISYPRTSSQKLPDKLGYKKIIEKLKKNKNFTDMCEKLLSKSKLKPNEGPKKDPAHPSIYPTGDYAKGLNVHQAKLYDMIVKRFLSVFGEPAIRESVKLTIDVNGEKFVTDGMRTVEENWIEFYRPYAKFKEQILPDVKKGDKIDGRPEILDKETQPPKRYTQASILKKMESLSLGTKATRAGILQTLYDRHYIKEKSIEVTTLGKTVSNVLDKYAPDIVSPKLTKHFELEMEQIMEEKKKKEDVIEEAKKTLEKMLPKFKENQQRIGQELLIGIRELMKVESTVGNCKCGGELTMRTSKNKKRFVGCTSYPKCTETFSLPQKGKITILSDKCNCGLNVLSIKAYGKRPWKLCIRDGFMSKKKEEGAVEGSEETGEAS